MKITIKLNERKTEAIICYFPKENGDALEFVIESAEAAAEKETDKLYRRYVPKTVREYIEKTEEARLGK